ncbi:multiprotein bridging factor aMBF1 [Thermofilum pendens]|uniref:multiprotein bridging factor aMBF1 n=1 Tax=Thermofilum pendens TaxID=2269 RepID=UPI0003223E27|nr:multiprotein bridging factor aMBF1 [Thermofilum pendens]
MVRCEICGREIRGPAYRVRVEGAELIVCSQCAKGKTVIGVLTFSQGAPSKPRTAVTRRRRGGEVEEIIVENYGEIIRSARERMGWTRDVLAAMVGEKESTIRRIEAGQLEPTIDLARKLEKVLKVKLIEELTDYGDYSEDYGYEGVTLGDIAEFRDRGDI